MQQQIKYMLSMPKCHDNTSNSDFYFYIVTIPDFIID